MSEDEQAQLPDAEKTSGQSSPPPPPAIRKPRQRRGCLATSLIALLTVGIFVLAIVVVILLACLGGSSPLFSSLNEEKNDIRERVMTAGQSQKKIIIIRVSGIIIPGEAISREHASSEMLIRQIRKAKTDPQVIAIILDMNTPGGSVTATDEVHHELAKIRKAGRIKLITCMRTIAASGGYYLAAGTDYVIANRLTLTGSIGVIMSGYNYHGLFEKIGVEPEVYKSGELKDVLNMARPRTDQERELIQELIGETFMEFATIVAEGRGLPIESILEGPIGDARIMSGAQAKELGLVDELGFLEDAIDKAKRMTRVIDPSVIIYAPEYSITDLFFASASDFLASLVPGNSRVVQRGTPYYLCPLAL